MPLALVPPKARGPLLEALRSGATQRELHTRLRGRFVYEDTLETPVAERWSQDRAPIADPKVKFRLGPEAPGCPARICLTVVVRAPAPPSTHCPHTAVLRMPATQKKSGSGQLPLSSKHGRRRFHLVCEVLAGSVWLPFAFSKPVKIISKMSCRGAGSESDGPSPAKKAKARGNHEDVLAVAAPPAPASPCWPALLSPLSLLQHPPEEGTASPLLPGACAWRV